MKKRFLALLALVLALFTVPVSSVFAASDIADGDYSVSITALEANSDKESVAGGFINDTATLSVEGDSVTLTLGVAKGGEGDGDYGDFDFSINWVTVEGNSHISKEDVGTEINYTFPLDEVKEILNAQMEYVVPGFPSLEDGHEVEFRIQLTNLADLPEAGEQDENGDNGNNEDEGTNDNEDGEGKEEDNGDANDETNGDTNDNDNGEPVAGDETEDNPQTGNSSNMGLYISLLVAAVAVAGIVVFARKRSVQ